MVVNVELAYKYKPSGQESPKRNRHYHKSESPLEKALEKYLNKLEGHYCPTGKFWTPRGTYARNDQELFVDSFYEIAKGILVDSNLLTQEALASAIFPFQDHPHVKKAGYFLSACYNNSPEKEFIFPEQDTAIDGLGVFLERGKSLIIKVDTDRDTGFSCKGTIVNYGNTTELSGRTVINFGYAGNCWETRYGSDPTINFGKAGKHWTERRKNFLINVGELSYDQLTPGGKQEIYELEKLQAIPRLKSYIDELKNVLGPHQSYQSVLKELSQRDIENDMVTILLEESPVFKHWWPHIPK